MASEEQNLHSAANRGARQALALEREVDLRYAHLVRVSLIESNLRGAKLSYKKSFDRLLRDLKTQAACHALLLIHQW
jgi:uncharacterized protein YjbI with pentapeptide repeats